MDILYVIRFLNHKLSAVLPSPSPPESLQCETRVSSSPPPVLPTPLLCTSATPLVPAAEWDRAGSNHEEGQTHIQSSIRCVREDIVYKRHWIDVTEKQQTKVHSVKAYLARVPFEL